MAEHNALGNTPHGAFTNADNPVSLAHEFYVTTSGCTLKGFRYYRADTNQTGAPVGSLWLVSGQTIVPGSALAFTSPTTTGWRETRFGAPIALTANTRYKVSVNFPSGWTNIADYWSSGAGASGRTSGPLVMVNTANSTGGQGTYDYGAGNAFCGNASGNSSSYAVDVIIDDGVTSGSTVTGAALASLGGLTATASGVRRVRGAAAATLGGLTATAVGKRAVRGVANAALGGLAATVTGRRRVGGTAVATLPGLAAAATGRRTVLGAVAASLPGVVATAVGRRTAAGSALAQLGQLIATALGRRIVNGTAAAALPGLVATITVPVPAADRIPVTVTSATVGGITVTAAATPGITVTGAEVHVLARVTT